MAKVLKDSVKIILISLAVSFSVYLALAQAGIWSEPVAAPPEGNLPAPLTLDSQGNLVIPGSLEVKGNFGITTDSKLIDYTYNLDISKSYLYGSSPACACDTTLNSVDCPTQFNSVDQGTICYDKYVKTTYDLLGNPVTRKFSKGYLRNSGNYSSGDVFAIRNSLLNYKGVNFTVQFINGLEDAYTSWSYTTNILYDSCPGNNINSLYTCAPNETFKSPNFILWNGRQWCHDNWGPTTACGGGGSTYEGCSRLISCVAQGYMTSQP